MGCLRAQHPRLVALTLPPPTVHSLLQTAVDTGPCGDGPTCHHHPQRELHPSLQRVELRGLGGERWPWGQEVAGQVCRVRVDQSISTRGGCCCTLSPAPVAVSADLGQVFFPPTFADPSP